MILKKLYLLYLSRFNHAKFVSTLGVNAGENNRYIGVTTSTFGSEPYLITLGEHVTLTSGVKFVTHDGGVWVFRDEFEKIEVFGKIEVSNNVFIGLNSILLPGTTIGENVVIAAGSVVRGNIQSDSVYGGVPAKKIMSLQDYKDKVMSKACHIKDCVGKDKVEKILKFLDD
jgi:acetyltransferase-like isoleucine patch superfamily enzyme